MCVSKIVYLKNFPIFAKIFYLFNSPIKIKEKLLLGKAFS